MLYDAKGIHDKPESSIHSLTAFQNTDELALQLAHDIQNYKLSSGFCNWL